MKRKPKISCKARKPSTTEAVLKKVKAGSFYTTVDPAAFVSIARVRKIVKGGFVKLKRLTRKNELKVDFENANVHGKYGPLDREVSNYSRCTF